MIRNGYHINKQFSDELEEKILSHVPADEKIVFVVAGDMTMNSKYGETAFAATEKSFVSIDDSIDGGFVFGKIEDVLKATVKRMYGNAELRITLKNGETIRALKFTYTIASLCEMAASYVMNVAQSKNIEEQKEIVTATYEKLMCVCPKCGRQLLHPGAQCINCSSKKRIASKLLKYIKPQTPKLIISLILAGISTALALLPPYVTKNLVDRVLPEKKMSELWILIAMLAASYVMGVSVNLIKSYLLRVSGSKMVEALRNDVYRKAQFLPMQFYDKTTTGSIINRVSSDCGTINSFVLRVTQEVLVQLFMLVGIIIIMFAMNWKLTLISLIPVPVIVVGSRIFRKKIAPFYRRIWRRWASVTSLLTDTIPCIRVIKAFAGEERTIDKFNQYNHEWLKTDVKSARITTSYPNLISFLVCIGSLLVWAIGGRWVIVGTGITAGLLVSFISYTSMFYTPVNFFAGFNDTYQEALTSIERVFDILDAEPEVSVSKNEILDHVEGRIEFRNVNFSFDKTKKVLSDINLKIEPGDIVGVVGTTGSGKTTLTNLLMRFYDNYDGEILLDGHNIKDLDISFYRSQIGYVQQEAMLFRDTVFNNIAYSLPGATVEQVIEAADVANAHEFIVRQPDAYDTMLGERGIGLSGGEKQRISIARAVLKNPSIMIFDEATASVDSETENLIQEAIERLISGRTTIMIAHRLSTLRKANKIIVVDQGRIIENGTHEQLMAAKGKYYRLVEIQNMSDKLREQQKNV